jgi:hypothetical protein
MAELPENIHRVLGARSNSAPSSYDNQSLASISSIGRAQVLRIFAGIVAFELLLVAGYLLEKGSGNSSWTVERLLDLDAEGSIAVWFSGFQLAAIGVVMSLRLLLHDKRHDPARWFIVLVSAGFCALSMDEVLQLHEQVTLWSQRSGLGDFWGGQGLLLSAVAALGLVLLGVSWRQIRVLWEFHRRAFLLIAAGLAIFCTGAIGLDLIAHLHLHGAGWLYTLEAAAEEFLEEFGGTVMLLGSLDFALGRSRRGPVSGAITS